MEKKLVYGREEIIEAVSNMENVMAEVEKGFIAYSEGKTQIPPVGYLGFPEHHGSTHIKYGYMEGDEVFVIKVASGFHDNAALGLPAGSGIVLVFSAVTGQIQAILADNGYLTDRRTAAAGAICAKYLAPSRIEAIGILGTGEQAREQLEAAKSVTEVRKVYVYGRNAAHAAAYRERMEKSGFDVIVADSPFRVAECCNLIITATPAESPLLYGEDIRPGTTVIAVGTDAPSKNEIDSSVFAKADVVVADSISQCVDHGDISYAVKNGRLKRERIIELGKVLQGKDGRRREEQIVVADLTGVAVQDIAIAKAALKNLR